MSATAIDQYCVQCEEPLVNGSCMNVNCEAGQTNVTTEADRLTAKSGGDANVDLARRAPRAWSSAGNVD